MTTDTKRSVRFNKVAQKHFGKLDKQAQRQIQKFLREKLLPAHNPRLLRKMLSGNYADFWRYHVGDYQIICKIEDSEFVILIVRAARRKEAYD